MLYLHDAEQKTGRVMLIKKRPFQRMWSRPSTQRAGKLYEQHLNKDPCKFRFVIHKFELSGQ